LRHIHSEANTLHAVSRALVQGKVDIGRATIVAFLPSLTHSGCAGIGRGGSIDAPERIRGALEHRVAAAGGFRAIQTTLIVAAYVCGRDVVPVEQARLERNVNEECHEHNPKKSDSERTADESGRRLEHANHWNEPFFSKLDSCEMIVDTSLSGAQIADCRWILILAPNEWYPDTLGIC
jgi:hypothetical protein